MSESFEQYSKPPRFTDVRRHNIPAWFFFLLCAGNVALMTGIFGMYAPGFVSAFRSGAYYEAGFYISLYLGWLIMTTALLAGIATWMTFKDSPPNP